MEYAYKRCAYENGQKILVETQADTTKSEVKKTNNSRQTVNIPFYTSTSYNPMFSMMCLCDFDIQTYYKNIIHFSGAWFKRN